MRKLFAIRKRQVANVSADVRLSEVVGQLKSVASRLDRTAENLELIVAELKGEVVADIQRTDRP